MLDGKAFFEMLIKINYQQQHAWPFRKGRLQAEIGDIEQESDI